MADIDKEWLLSVLDARFAATEKRMDARFASIGSRLDGIATGMAAIESRMVAIESRMVAIETRMEAIETRMDALEEKWPRALEAMETKLLTAFHGWAGPIDMRLRSHSAVLRAIDLEIEAIKDKIDPDPHH